MCAPRFCHVRPAVAIGTALCLLTGSLTLAERATRERLGGGDRYLTVVSTDKPIYRIGEKVYVRGVLLHAADRTPLKATIHAQVEIRGPKGDIVASGMTPAQESVLGYAWEVPAGQPGGQYTVKVSYPLEGYAPAERSFDVRAYRAPRLKSQIVFLRDGYAPGDEVRATLHTERAEGGIPAGAKVNIIARVDNAEVHTAQANVDPNGNCEARFKLPARIARGEGTLAFAVQDGAAVETAAKTLPILLQTVDLELYPEGGDLIAGLPARVYLQARTPARKPADIAGVVIDAEGREIAAFRTQHEGRGRFEFTPKVDGKYRLKVLEPTGIRTQYPLPAVKPDGAAILAMSERTPRREPLRLRIASTRSAPLTVTLAKRETLVASLRVDASAGQPVEVALTPPDSADGVLIATVWDQENRPLAERLVYREPARALRVAITPESKAYVPGDMVNLTLETTDDAGRPVGAVVGLTVTDDSILEMIEKREQAPRLPVMVLLEADVRELADAHVYLDPANPDADRAVDLLLGTQGWRRFAFIESETFLKQYGDAARRVLALRTPPSPESRSRFFAMDGIAFGRAGGPQPVAAPAARNLGAPRPEMMKAGVDEEAQLPAAIPQLAEPGQQAMGLDKAQEPLIGGRLPAAEAQRDANFRRIMPQQLVSVRVYAHAARPNRQPGERIDFTETLYWNAAVATDPATGKASVSFALSDAATTFRVFADAFDASGALGATTTAIESVQPFYIEPRLPLEVTTGDRVQLPVGLVNAMSHALPQVRLTTQVPAGVDFASPEPFDLQPGERVRRFVDLSIGKTAGILDLTIHARAGALADSVTRQLNVKPLGFPVEVAAGGMLGPDSAVSHPLEISENFVAGSLTARIAVYPTPLANMTAALERLIREPHGCFEQSSSTVYPLVMAQQYFLTHTGVEPALIERSRAMLEKGYAKLASFECKQRGYEWFGGDPGHEALTAYGLLEFTDMAGVRSVDNQMLARTREWLLKRRDGKGGFLRDPKALDSFGGAPEATTNAYITWALATAGEKALTPEIENVKRAAASSDDTYVIALAANVCAAGNDQTAAKKFMDALAKKQARDGSLEGGVSSITRSGGEALTIETTALGVLAWLQNPAYAPQVENAMRYLAESCKAGRFGSTQSTVLALRAIVEYDKSRAKPKAPGSVQIYVDGRSVGEAVAFDAQTQGAIELPDIAKQLEPGRHTIELKMIGGSSMPYAVAVNYYDTQPASSPDGSLDLRVALNDRSVVEGGITEAEVIVTNKSGEAAPTPVAIIGLPGGLEPRHDQLKELVKSGRIDAYEVIGREIVLYWRQLKPGQKVQLPITLIAAIPGTYTGPASRAYLYYTDEHKTWVPGTTITITPRR